MDLSFYSSTFPGDRDYNEDSVMAAGSEMGYCFVVADGLGGHGKGEVASASVCDTAKAVFTEYGAENLEKIFETAQSELLELQKRERAEDGMKTTMNVVTVTGSKICWGHVGDTRTYYFRKKKLVSRTKDHSVPQMMVSLGEIKEKDIRQHPDRNRLLKVMGIEWTKPQYTLETPLKAEKNQAFLMCTDGFWEYIEEKDMMKCLKKAKNVKEWLDAMNEIVKKNGAGHNMDNFTALVFWIE